MSEKGQKIERNKLVRSFVDMQYERNDFDFSRGKFRIRGDTLEILPAYEEIAMRIEFWGDVIERIVEDRPPDREMLAEKESIDIFPAKHFVTSQDKLEPAIEDIKAEMAERLAELNRQGKLLEAARLEQRTNYDLEMLKEAGLLQRRGKLFAAPAAQRSRAARPGRCWIIFPRIFCCSSMNRT